MPTYPFQVPTGVSIIPFGSGNQDLGSTSKYLGIVYANSFVQTGTSAGSISAPAATIFSGLSIWNGTNGTALADTHTQTDGWAIQTGTSDLNGTLTPTGNALANVGTAALPLKSIVVSGIFSSFQAPQVWCAFDQANGTPTISGSHNVSSLTDGGAGITTVNFTTSLGNSLYGAVGSATNAAGQVGVNQIQSLMPTGIICELRSTAGDVDFKINSINCFSLTGPTT